MKKITLIQTTGILLIALGVTSIIFAVQAFLEIRGLEISFVQSLAILIGSFAINGVLIISGVYVFKLQNIGRILAIAVLTIQLIQFICSLDFFFQLFAQEQPLFIIILASLPGIFIANPWT